MLQHPLRSTATIALVAISLPFPPQQAHALDPDAYLGHLQLDANTIVVTEAVTGLDVPWDIEAGSDGIIWFTQHAGSVSRFDPQTETTNVVLESIPELYHKKSLGLLGMALHPDFENTPAVFLHYTYQRALSDLSEIIESRLVRYRFDGKRLVDPETLFEGIPGKSYHNGSRIAIGPDGKLYLTTGDAGDPHSSQNPAALSGKVLRLNLDGSIPSDNPNPSSPIWSLGHRNPQGLVFSDSGKLYASEHGPNNDDEINLIQPGHNYGWPRVEGFVDRENEVKANRELDVTEPLYAWTPTIATAGLAYLDNDTRIREWKNSLLLVALKGRALRVLSLSEDGERITSERIYFQKRFGRMRDVAVAPNGDIYLATSNLDWHPRYQSWMYDSLPEGNDRIIRLRFADESERSAIAKLENAVEITEDPEPISLSGEDWSFAVSDVKYSEGERLYLVNCAACHNPLGTGAPGLLPPLAGTDWVTGDKGRLIRLVLSGMSGPIQINGDTYDQEMPAFAHLNDSELAAILSYIRTSFGNQASGVIEGEVADERAALGK